MQIASWKDKYKDICKCFFSWQCWDPSVSSNSSFLPFPVYNPRLYHPDESPGWFSSLRYTRTKQICQITSTSPTGYSHLEHKTFLKWKCFKLLLVSLKVDIVIQNFDQICLAVLTFIGHKQTNGQAKYID